MFKVVYQVIGDPYPRECKIRQFIFLGYSVNICCVDEFIFNMSKEYLYTYKLSKYLQSNPYHTGHNNTENTEIVEVTGVEQFRESYKKLSK